MKKWLTLLGMTLGFVAASAAAQLPDFTELAENSPTPSSTSPPPRTPSRSGAATRCRIRTR
jgi:hypothetical protein